MRVQSIIIVNTDHFQMLFGDRDLGPTINTAQLWDSDGSVVTVPGHEELVGIAIARFGGATHVRVEVSSKPAEKELGWKPMGKFIVNVPSGTLSFWGPESLSPEREPRVLLPRPGRYHGEAFSMGTETVNDEMALTGGDVYRIDLWPVEGIGGTTERSG